MRGRVLLTCKLCHVGSAGAEELVLKAVLEGFR